VDTTLLIVLGFWLLCGLAAGFIAREKGADGSDGFLIGVLLGPLGLLMAFTGKKTEPVDWAQPQATPPPTTPEWGSQPNSTSPPGATTWGAPTPPPAATFCPRCGTARAGSFRYCRSCGLDFDSA
jgi:hypothetical protein